MEPPANFLFGDTTICRDAEIVLFANRVFKDYLWSNSTTLSTTKISTAKMYWLTATDYYGCKGADTIAVFYKYCDGIFYMPTAFTPNADKVNDVLKPIINAPLVNFSFAIYNRFGQQLFSTNNVTNGWNGIYNGQLQETGGYVWQCSYTIKNKPPQFKKGTVVLLQ
jgi:gliding motility-associated-like protein